MTPAEPTVVFLGSGRCFHTMDWFRSAQLLRPDRPPILITDLLEGESFLRLVLPGDKVEHLLIIDPLLARGQSRLADVWRNLVKFGMLPLQALRLRWIFRRYRRVVIHAHSMYYIAIARLSGQPYVATPQGSEVLVRPYRSRLYRAFARAALAGAGAVTVDSRAMQESLRRLYGIESTLIQNGIALDCIFEPIGEPRTRDKLVSPRGLVANYRILELIEARNRALPRQAISFCYPFEDRFYRNTLRPLVLEGDEDLGRLARDDLYALLRRALLVVSIPVSDSSPRSVYEAVFCGCVVATVAAGWVDALPACMRARIIPVSLEDPDWLAAAWRRAGELAVTPYVPSQAALQMFDQKLSMKRIYDEIFPKLVVA